MKKRYSKLICLIGVLMFLIPIFGLNSFGTAQDTENSLIVGAVLGSPKAWDPAISQADSMGYIKSNAVQSLIWGDTKGNPHPLLAESWIIHERPSGTSAAGANDGGVASYEFTLRDDVVFHDGSAFNASVAKWNIDRITQISGYENSQWRTIHWMSPSSYSSRFIPTWNLSWAINDPEVSFIDTAAWETIADGSYINYTGRSGVGATDLVEYYIWFDTDGLNNSDPAPAGRMEIYVNISAATVQENVSVALSTGIGAIPGITASSNVNNVTISNGFDGDTPSIVDHDSGLAVSKLEDGIIRNTFKTADPELIPMVNSTIVVSEFVLNITFNKWFTNIGQMGWYGFISQESYGPWFNKSINGYDEVPDAYDGTPFPGHMIGTGPYEYESHDFLVDPKAHSTKFEDYWNATALEADGYFAVTDLYIRYFADYTARGNALLATDIDLTNAMLQDPAPIADVKASPYINYYGTVPDASVNVVFLQSAESMNEPLDSLGGKTTLEWFPTSPLIDKWGLAPGTELPGGINLTVRKAISYAYDYNGFIAAVYPETGGGGVYCWSPWGMSSEFTDESVSHPGPEPDLLAARQILLDDPYYAAEIAARGLDIDSTDAEWNDVAVTDPIDTYTLLAYPAMLTKGFMTECLENIGFGIDIKEDAAVPNDLWVEFVATGKASLYDMVSYVTLMNPKDPSQYGPYWYSSAAARLPYGWGYNYPHLRNGTADAIFSNIEFLADKQASYNELADILINKEVPAIYESQGNMGMALNAGFTFDSWAIEVGGVAGPGISISALGGSRMKPTPEVAIPGFSTLFMLYAMIPTILGSIYVIKRKSR